MFLEAQFGADAVSPVAEPKLPASDEDDEDEDDSTTKDGARLAPTIKPETDGAEDGDGDGDDETGAKLSARQRAELDRLHGLGIPVPGVRIRVDDKMTATVWLETLEVESPSRPFADRVRAVVERAAEVTAPLWG